MPIEINILVINDFLFQKEEQPEWPETKHWRDAPTLD
jgi:hypothetical protein